MNNPSFRASGERLRRQGSQLRGEARKWDMLNVQGPLELPGASDPSREYFRIETASAETLVVYRSAGDRGMRELYLFAVTRK